MKRLMITTNSVMKFQNLIVNHESWPIESNPESLKKNDQLLIDVFYLSFIFIISFFQTINVNNKCLGAVANPKVPCSEQPLGSSKIDSAFHLSKVD